MMTDPTNITLNEAAEFFKERDDFLILSHASPDGDTFGCSYALCGALQRMGKRAKIRCADPLPKNFSHLLKAIEIQKFEERTIVSVDIADSTLLGALKDVYGDRVELAIDHHLSHAPFAEKIFVDSSAAACAEIIFDLLELMEVKLDSALAVCLYTGIATDTGCFKFANTTSATHEKAAKLMQFDFNFGDLNYILFEMKTPARIELERRALENMEIFCGGKGAIVAFSKETLANADAEDINGISSLPRQIQGVEVGVVLKEKQNGVWKASMRSNNINVQEICGKFGGGGHERAAGCTVNGDGETAKRLIKTAVQEAIDLWTE